MWNHKLQNHWIECNNINKIHRSKSKIQSDGIDLEGSSSNERKVKTVNFNFKKGSVVNNNRQEILNLHEKDKSTSQYTNTIQPVNSDFYLNRQRRHLEICIPSWEEIEKSEIERHNYNISTSHNKIYNQDSGLRNVESDCHYNSNKNKNNNNNHEHKSNENSWQIHSDKSDHTTRTNKHATNSIKSVYPSTESTTSLTQKLLDRYKTNKQQSKKAESTRSDQFCQAKSRREAYNEIFILAEHFLKSLKSYNFFARSARDHSR